MNDATNTTLATRTVIVHKRDEECALTIDALTGRINQPIAERPGWAEGHVMALLGERLKFYETRLGASFSPELKTPDMIAYEDLGWLGVDEDGEEVETTADEEYRMQVVSEAFGITRPDNLDEAVTYGSGTKLAEVEIGMDTARSAEQHEAFNAAQDEAKQRGHG